MCGADTMGDEYNIYIYMGDIYLYNKMMIINIKYCNIHDLDRESYIEFYV